MNKSSFLDKQNIATLWDVISDEELFKSHNADVKNTILQLFSDNIKGFYNSESKNSKITLMEMNKKYILMVLNFIKAYYPKPTINKIVIKEEIQLNNKELITFEERQKERLTEFDTKLQLVEEEFKNAITRQVPETPDFSDNVKEKPIIEMEKAIKEITEQRNYEIQQITQQQITQQQITQQTSQDMNTRVTNSVSKNKLKHIQWADETQGNIRLDLEEKEDNDEINIFSKLKPIIKEEKTDVERNRIHKLEENVQLMKKEIDEIKTSISEILGILKR